MPTPADEAHRVAQLQLAETVADRLGVMIGSLPDPRSQAAMDAYNVAAAQLVAGAQLRSTALTFAYLRRPRAPRRPSAARALEGVLVTSESPVARSPILRLWHDLDEGDEHPVAVASAATYASRLASTDLAMAMRGGLGEAASASGLRITGWQKQLGPAACSWCRSEAGTIHDSPGGVPFHAHDTCSVSPVYEEA